MTERQPAADVLFVMAIRPDNRYPFIVAHCVNTAIFAAKIGAGLGLSRSRQIQIGLAALLHDIGTALIPENIVNKAGRLTEQELALFRERPQRSYRILHGMGDSTAYLADIAQQVYERIDGSGYPLGLKGDEIHEDAQIIGLVDMYEALVHNRPHRENWLHFAAVKEIIKHSKSAFQRKHLKCLLNVFSIFPVSSYVRLNSDAVGRVIETYPDQPMRPKLQIIFDSQMRKVLAERIVKLSENPLLNIVDSVSERELKEMDDAWEFDHYIDLENVPAGALHASDRYEFIAALHAAGIRRPQQFVGFLPWRTLEVYQRLLTEFAIWRNLQGDPRQPFVEARILNDAGILGHYAADAAQPHHTTIHFNGWAEGAPNPRGFTTARDFHARFESDFVRAHVTFRDVDALMTGAPMTVEDVRELIWSHVQASHAAVERMYELELEHGFDPEAPPNPAVTEFVFRRMVEGAQLLRALWWSAWTKSEDLAAQLRAQGWTP